jgi:hypothetical protein
MATPEDLRQYQGINRAQQRGGFTTPGGSPGRQVPPVPGVLGSGGNPRSPSISEKEATKRLRQGESARDHCADFQCSSRDSVASPRLRLGAPRQNPQPLRAAVWVSRGKGRVGELSTDLAQKSNDGNISSVVEETKMT